MLKTKTISGTTDTIDSANRLIAKLHKFVRIQGHPVGPNEYNYSISYRPEHLNYQQLFQYQRLVTPATGFITFSVDEEGIDCTNMFPYINTQLFLFKGANAACLYATSAHIRQWKSKTDNIRLSCNKEVWNSFYSHLSAFGFEIERVGANNVDIRGKVPGGLYSSGITTIPAFSYDI